MRHLPRQVLSQQTTKFLARRESRIQAEPEGLRAAEARRLWRTKPSAALREVRAVLLLMASGRARCMYCEDGLGDGIDHFRPIASYPLFAFAWTNLLLACAHCNSNSKRNRFPVDPEGGPLLIDPTLLDPTDHLRLVPSTGYFHARTEVGATTIEVFGLNDDLSPRRLPAGRLDAIDAFQTLILRYRGAMQRGDLGLCEEVRGRVGRMSFAGAVHWVVRECTNNPAARVVFGDEFVETIRIHRVAEWIVAPHSSAGGSLPSADSGTQP